MELSQWKKEQEYLASSRVWKIWDQKVEVLLELAFEVLQLQVRLKGSLLKEVD